MAEAMSETEVPADLMLAAELAAYEVLKQDHKDPPAMWMALVHRAVAAVLPLHEQQIRATQPPLTDEWGIGTDYTDTTRSEQAVSDNLAEALHLLDIARIHRRPDVVSEGLIVREVGEWRKPEEER